MDETQKRSLRQQVIQILQLNADGEHSAADVVSDLCELIERGNPRITAVRIMQTVTSSGRSGVESDGDDATTLLPALHEIAVVQRC